MAIRLLFEGTGDEELDGNEDAPVNAANLFVSMAAYIVHSPADFARWRSWSVQQAMVSGEHEVARWLRRTDRGWLAWLGQQLLEGMEVSGDGNTTDAEPGNRGDGPEAG